LREPVLVRKAIYFAQQSKPDWQQAMATSQQLFTAFITASGLEAKAELAAKTIAIDENMIRFFIIISL
jgi:3D (Asp-Asp-Asp) domain-containing protein